MRWQRRARVVVGIVGIASAIAIYAAMGERVAQRVASLPQRSDPNALVESSGNVLQQVRGTRQDYRIEAERQFTYTGGATTLIGVRITVSNRGGRDYVVTAHEARAGENQRELQLTGGVTLAANDGFVLHADSGAFNQDTGLMTAPGAVTFGRGRMTGSGVGMSYDKNHDTLMLADQSHVVLSDEQGATTLEFASGRSIFARMAHTLTLDSHVRALRGGQAIEATEGVARLTPDEQQVTDIALRGQSRVAGGGAGIDSMSARDMDLHYAADGETLERVALRGDGAVALAGQGGSVGRRFAGDTLDIRLAPDGSLAKATGSGSVRLDLPGSADSPARSIRARTIDADGAPGRGLTAATFTDGVEYREEQGGAAVARVAQSRSLTIALAGDAVRDAGFTGAVKFEEQGLSATGGTARYDPTNGSLRLAGVEAGVVPRVRDNHVTIDAPTIDVVLEGRLMKATGGVKTALRARATTGPGEAGGGDSTKLPSLLKQDQPANVNADALDYQGTSGKAIYVGGATLWQGETAIRADRITIDQGRGDLLAAGDARSSIVLDTGVSIAHAATIAYADAAHTLTYETAVGSPGAVAARPQLSGPQGDLHADRIEVLLAERGGHIDRLEAYASVSLILDARGATAERLTYFAADERYVMTGGGAKPVTLVERCKETTGKTVTFFKSTDRIIVDGNEEIRTQTRSGAGPACVAPPPPR